MKTDATPWWDYSLPVHLIAQEPSSERDQARLMVVRRRQVQSSIMSFTNCRTCSRPGTCLS